MDITLHLPVRSYVLKYFQARFGEPGKPFTHWRLDIHLKEGKMIYAMLERSMPRYEKLNKDEAELRIQLPDRAVRYKGCYLSQESIDLLNDYVKQTILDEILLFHTGINSQIGLKAIDRVTINQYQSDKTARVYRIKTKNASKFFWQKSIINDVLSKYGITEDEISSESIAKHLQRNCKFQVSA